MRNRERGATHILLALTVAAVSLGMLFLGGGACGGGGGGHYQAEPFAAAK